jgi:prevent-host-death family protein
MQTVSATYAKQNFAAVLDQAQKGPVRIRRHDRDVAVILAPEEYEWLNRNRPSPPLRRVPMASQSPNLLTSWLNNVP